ncbi:hypothetical protein K9U33_06130 [Rhodoblastus acidophilus]|uniref:Secreted protein n=1 Tax=Candidatus Rhodoblastus alkanivorans TaxID=2954117 RepID=A0ABS9Z3Q6_9HYPH|nr:hypothetical protein [Candidatus Rhodoblastus alkanivorans]MCI4678227.1 hypothetical protein [Candidatus Rhodoblastus alkanivorans]MCI4681277.1 hypothetical protein [Candidatus Rhodoblastus alkanivorans]
MRVFDQQLFRLGLVLALGSGLAVAATYPSSKPKAAARERPAPIVLAVAYEHSAQQEAVGARVDQCSLNPHDNADNSPIGDKTHHAKKRKVVICG